MKYRTHGQKYMNPKWKRTRTSFKSKRQSLSEIKKPSFKYRRHALSAIENLSFNSRRYLNRNLTYKLYEDNNRIKKSTKPVRRIGSKTNTENREAVVEMEKVLDTSCSTSYKLRSAPKCKFCRESTATVINYPGAPPFSKTEADVLAVEELKVCEETIDDLSQCKLTAFCIFDEAGHLCAFDGNLLQNNVNLYFSGYIKPIYEDNPEVEGGYPAAKMGPITEWWIAGYEEGEKTVIGISSELGDYYLLQPIDEYTSFMNAVVEKAQITKNVIEFLKTKCHEKDTTFNDLLNHLERQEPPVDEKTLLKFADFIYDQALSYDSNASDDEPKLMVDSQCIKTLADLAGIPLRTEVVRPVKRRRALWVRKDSKFIKATTTSLVENVFESIFNKQMNKSTSDTVLFRPCVVKLTRLENLYRYAGSWKIKPKGGEEKKTQNSIAKLKADLLKKKLIRPCTVRVKPLTADVLNKYLKKLKQRLKRTDIYINDSKPSKRKLSLDTDMQEVEYVPKKVRKFNKPNGKWVWTSEPDQIDDKPCYQSAMCGDQSIHVENFVTMLDTNEIGHIQYMYEDDDQKPQCHVQWFVRSCDTILGDEGNQYELFLTEDCEDVTITNIDKILEVSRLPMMSNWHEIGNFSLTEWNNRPKSKNAFFFQKRYDVKYGHFRDLEVRADEIPNSCHNCYKKKEVEIEALPMPIGETKFDEETKQYTINAVRWQKEDFKVGSCVFLKPGSLIPIRVHSTAKEISLEEEYDEEEYPEKYRKKYTCDDVDNPETEPFNVGLICGIVSSKQKIRHAQDVSINVKVFYRPQQTHLSENEARQLDLNLLYWSNEERLVKFDQVEGKCFVTYEDNLDGTPEEWSTRGPYRFYFNKAYDRKAKQFTEPSRSAMKLGNLDIGKTEVEVPIEWPSISRPLRTMDVFAGCGGLSEGLHQSGVADCHWAIEKFEAPARAFEKNNPNAAVFIDDCNHVLETIIKGEKYKDGKRLPQKGDVELLCGGPPCQGFSRLNRFREGEYSQFKNSLVVSYLSYCDYFRPRFFVMENVRDFVSLNKNMVFKVTLNCLVKMGYQVGFSVLQCGKYGIPQSRRRAIIIAAAPGETLPRFPEPTHSFMLNKYLDVNVDGRKYATDLKWTTAAPYRMITVWDALSDLPAIKNNDKKKKMLYRKEPLTHFQQLSRGSHNSSDDILYDHVCKQLNPLVLARISCIPREPNADWRDLPNIVMRLDDGTYTEKLIYTHHDQRNGKSPRGALRGVCLCASNPKAKCEAEYKQANTIIPWCLPHTGNRHHQWSGLYGRLKWNGYFQTVVTNPEPMGKQGRVLHPEQNRVLSIRECARSQGFSDKFQFVGNFMDKYAQIGNAVAPPLAKAIGYEIRKSISAAEAKKSTTRDRL